MRCVKLDAARSAVGGEARQLNDPRGRFELARRWCSSLRSAQSLRCSVRWIFHHAFLDNVLGRFVMRWQLGRLIYLHALEHEALVWMCRHGAGVVQRCVVARAHRSGQVTHIARKTRRMRNLIFAAGLLLAFSSTALAQDETQANPAQPAPAVTSAPQVQGGAALQAPPPVYSCRRLRRAADINAVSVDPLSYYMIADQVAKIRIGHEFLRTWQSHGVWTPNECETTQTCAMQPDDTMLVTSREGNTAVTYTWQAQDYLTLSRDGAVLAICHVIRDPDLPPPTDEAPRRRRPPGSDGGMVTPQGSPSNR